MKTTKAPVSRVPCFNIFMRHPVYQMNKLEHASAELRQMDELADLDSPVHSLHPLTKLLITIAYIVLVISCGKYRLPPLIMLCAFPFIAYSFSGLKLSTCFYKLRFVLPLVCAVGLFNPFFDRAPLLAVGKLSVSGGVISMLSLMLKGVLCLSISFLLAATTRIDALCSALRRLHVPGFLVSLLLLTYRYVGLMVEELGIMTNAYALRAPGQKGIAFKAWGSFAGQLLLRSMDRAEELYSSMKLRGFKNEFYYAENGTPARRDYGFAAGSLVLLLVLRFADILFT